MADPVVHITNGVPDSGTGNITTLGAVVAALGTPMQASGGSVTANAGTNLNTSALALEAGGNLAAAAGGIGATADAVVAAGAAGSLSAKLRAISRDLVANVVLAAGTNIIGQLNVLFNGTTPDLGSGTGGTATQRIYIDSSQVGSAGPAAASTSVSVTPANTSDVTSSRINSAASTNATNLKASAALIRSIDVFNVAAYNVFLKIYAEATAPTVGTDTPIWTIPIPAGGGFSAHWPVGKPVATGLSYAITKLQADTDTTAVVANDLTGSIDWV